MTDLDDLIGGVSGFDEGPPEQPPDVRLQLIQPKFRSWDVKWAEAAYISQKYGFRHPQQPPENQALAWRCFNVSYSVFPANDKLKRTIPYAKMDAVIEFTDSFGGKHRFWMWNRSRKKAGWSGRFKGICENLALDPYPKERNYIEMFVDYTIIRQSVRYCEGTVFQLEWHGHTSMELENWKPFGYDADCSERGNYDDIYGDPWGWW